MPSRRQQIENDPLVLAGQAMRVVEMYDQLERTRLDQQNADRTFALREKEQELSRKALILDQAKEERIANLQDFEITERAKKEQSLSALAGHMTGVDFRDPDALKLIDDGIRMYGSELDAQTIGQIAGPTKEAALNFQINSKWGPEHRRLFDYMLSPQMIGQTPVDANLRKEAFDRVNESIAARNKLTAYLDWAKEQKVPVPVPTPEEEDSMSMKVTPRDVNGISWRDGMGDMRLYKPAEVDKFLARIHKDVVLPALQTSVGNELYKANLEQRKGEAYLENMTAETEATRTKTAKEKGATFVNGEPVFPPTVDGAPVEDGAAAPQGDGLVRRAFDTLTLGVFKGSDPAATSAPATSDPAPDPASKKPPVSGDADPVKAAGF